MIYLFDKISLNVRLNNTVIMANMVAKSVNNDLITFIFILL